MSGATRDLTERFHKLQQQQSQSTSQISQPKTPQSVITYETLKRYVDEIHIYIAQYKELCRQRQRVSFDDRDDELVDKQIMQAKSNIFKVLCFVLTCLTMW
jgi:hypothetical protein